MPPPGSTSLPQSLALALYPSAGGADSCAAQEAVAARIRIGSPDRPARSARVQRLSVREPFQVSWPPARCCGAQVSAPWRRQLEL